MANRDKIDRIDARFKWLQPGWRKKDYQGERRMLYEALDDDEGIEYLSGGGWNVSGVGNHDRGVVVATDRRVLLLNKGRFKKNLEEIPYWGIESVEETSDDEVEFPSLGLDYAAKLSADASADFVRQVRGRLLTDAASVQAAFSQFLDTDEKVELWLRSSGGKIVVKEYFKDNGARGPQGNASYDTHRAVFTAAGDWLECMVLNLPLFMVKNVSSTVMSGRMSGSGVIVGTDRRVLFVSKRTVIDAPYAGLLATRLDGHYLKFTNTEGAYGIRPDRIMDVGSLASLLGKCAAAYGDPGTHAARIFAQWQMQQPIWHHQSTHVEERDVLPEIMEDDEHIEGLLYGRYRFQGESWNNGVIVATDRRLIFVNRGIFDRHDTWAPYEAPYEGIRRVSPVRDYKELKITPEPGYSGYQIEVTDDKHPYDTGKNGHGKEFVAILNRLIPNQVPEEDDTEQEPPDEAVATGRLSQSPPDEMPPQSASERSPRTTRRDRLNEQWQKGSSGWELNYRENERRKLYEVLEEDEEIEGLVDGNYAIDEKGAKSQQGVVIAATDRRLVFVYNGIFGEHVGQVPYTDIERVNVKKGRVFARMTITCRPGMDDYAIENITNDPMLRFADQLRPHVPSS